MRKEKVTLGNTDTAKHLYDIGVGEKREESRIDVYANNRTQAESIAKKAGYFVRDINMIG